MIPKITATKLEKQPVFWGNNVVEHKKNKSTIYNNRYSHCNISDSVSFSGQLEDTFFQAIKEGNQKLSIDSLSKINFNIVEQDIENGNNVLHYVIQDNSEALWEKLHSLLKNIVFRVTPEKVDRALMTKNKNNKLPYECAIDDVFLKRIQNDINEITKNRKPRIENPIVEKSSNLYNPIITEVEKVENKVVGNEISTSTEIDTDLDFDDFMPVKGIANTALAVNSKEKGELFSDVIGLNNAKQVLKEFIVDPIEKNKPILVNGILLYGQGNNGKSYLVESLCKHLNKEIISTRKVLGLLDGVNQAPKEIEKILSRYVISISIDDYRDVDNVLEYIKTNYKNTNKQTMMFIDEIAKIFQTDQNSGRYSYRDVPEFMRKFDNFSLNGGVLIGTTNDIEYIQEDLLRSNRFQKRVELKFPNQDERRQIFENFLGDKLQISDLDHQKIIKKTAGFSYGDLSAILRILDAENDEINYKLLDEIVEKYAEENNMGQLSDEGTTSNYDTKLLSREQIDTNFSDVAGMEDIKNIFRKTIIDRLKPEVKQRFSENKRPFISTNFLLYGPPGTGKTFIVKALSGEAKVPLYIIDGASFMDKYVGESEKNLKKIFKQLETKFKETGEYSILFIDEGNKILGKRDNINSKDSEYVEQLLQYLDNSYKRGIITITATNYKDKIDDAVLSRLGQQIMIGFPDIETIRSLIEILLKDINTASNIKEQDIYEIASRLRGFGSREVTQIITGIIDENLQAGNKKLCLDDFKSGISIYAQSHELPAINERNRTSAYDKFIKRLEILSSDPQSLDDIGGMQETKEKLLNAVMASSLKPEILERYKNNRIKGQNGILLYGDPGCGKTYIMKALAAHMNLPIYEFKMSQFGSKFSHETTENIGKVFNQLKNKYKATGERSILMLDEFEDVASRRENEPNAFRVEETNALLKEISDAERNGIIVVAATNHFDRIDAAMKRPGRFICIEVTSPDLDARKDLIKKALSSREIADKIFENDENFDVLAKETEGFAIVDITETINILIKESIDNNVAKLSLENLQLAFAQRAKDKARESKLNQKRQECEI